MGELQERAASKGLVILAFPCNQFGGQEPGTAQEVETWAREKYGASWYFMEKVEVNGSGTHPLFAFLKTAQPGFLINPSSGTSPSSSSTGRASQWQGSGSMTV